MSINGKTLTTQSTGSITLKIKKNCSFIQFDIKDFYPSITEEILEEAISFAKSLIDIDDHKVRTIKHCRKSLLFHNNVA